MSIHRFRPSARQELLGRIALVAAGVMVSGVGAVLGWLCFRMIMGMGELDAGETGMRLGWPGLVMSAFLALVGLSLCALALMPSRDHGRGPPRGFATLTRIFDGFWEIVSRVTSRI